MKKQAKHNPITPKNHLLPEKAYEEYEEIFINKFGYKPKKDELVRGANDLINLFRLISEPKVRTSSRQSD